jgi:hypothetical protein
MQSMAALQRLVPQQRRVTPSAFVFGAAVEDLDPS